MRKRTCTICGEPHVARGLCRYHYRRWWKTADRSEIREHYTFNLLIELTALRTTDCIIWTGTTRDQYGVVYVDRKPTPAHRAALIIHTGGDRPSMDAAHGPCHNPLCINASGGHVYWATPARNAADRERDGTALRGDGHPSRKLSSTDVLDIRERLAAGELGIALADEYGVRPTNISQIKHRHTWKQI